MPTRLSAFVLSVALAAGALLLPSRAGAAETAVPRPTGPQIMHFGNGTEPQDIDPQVVTGVPEHKIIKALFEGLLAEDPVDLHPVPGVAERWEVSEDKLTYTFHLRGDARWSNGDPVTAGDFLRSYQRILTPSLASEYSYLLWHVVGAEAYNAGELKDFSQVGFSAPDERTLVVRLRAPAPFFLNLVASHYSWFPVHLPTVEKFGGVERKGTAWTRPENFVGNGPFILKEWRPNQKLIVAKSPSYWDRATVKLEEIHFYPVESSDTEERMFRSGQLHRTNELPVSKIDVYKRRQPELLRMSPYLGTYFYRLNTTRPPLDDVRVRRALALAIDRGSLVRNVTKGGQRPGLRMTPPDTLGYTAEAQLRFDPEEAKRLLGEAGFPNGRGFPKVRLLYNTSENHRVIAEAIQGMWRTHLGVEIELENQEWKVYLDSQDTLSYDLSRAGWIADYVDPHVFLEIWRTGGGNNDTGWSNSEYDRLLEQSLRAPSEAERYALYQQMEKLLLAELPMIPLYHYTRVHLLSPKVKGYHPTLLDHHPWKHVWLEE